MPPTRATDPRGLVAGGFSIVALYTAAMSDAAPTDRPDADEPLANEPANDLADDPTNDPAERSRIDAVEQRREDRSRTFVRICLSVLVAAMLFGGCVVYSFIPSVETDPELVAETKQRLAGGLRLPAGFEPSRAVSIKPLFLIPGESVLYERLDDSGMLVASLYRGATEPPARSILDLVDATEHTISYMGEERPVTIGNVPAQQARAQPLRMATTWIRTSEGALQVSLTTSTESFDDEATLRLFESIGS